jgi:hypothetical protein
MTLLIASDFMEAALATMILPIGVFIALVIWFARSSRRYRVPVGQVPGAIKQITTEPAQTPPDTPEPEL